MAEGEVVYVVTYPPGALNTELVKTVAGLVGKDPYDTRLLLSGEMPRIIARYQIMQEAESIARSLRGMGITAFTCGDAELRRLPGKFIAHTLEFAGDGVLFRNRMGQTRRIGSEEGFLIIRGRAEIVTDMEYTETKMKVNWRATLMTGGVPIMRRFKETKGEATVEKELFIRVYDRESSESCVEILRHQMDYSCLGADMALSTQANLSTIAAKLRAAFPQAVLDEKMMKPHKVDIITGGARENLEINCRLLYMYYKNVSGA